MQTMPPCIYSVLNIVFNVKYNAYLKGKSTILGDCHCIYFQELVDLVQGMKAQYDMQINVSLFVVQEESQVIGVEVFKVY